MNISGHDVGVCSWSLRQSDIASLVATVKSLGLNHVQLGLAGLLALSDSARAAELAILKQSGIVITAGMISFPHEDYSSIAIIRETGGYIPDAHWPDRRSTTAAAIVLAKSLGLTQLSTHVGFVPPSDDPDYLKIIDRVSEIASLAQSAGIELLLETGQEPASELLQFLNDLRVRNVGINFDPANMILYGAGDPIAAIGVLDRHIRHVHVKDATASSQPGVDWGEEVAFGKGEVPHVEFIEALHAVGYSGPLVIEREAGSDRVGDVAYAIEALKEIEATLSGDD